MLQETKAHRHGGGRCIFGFKIKAKKHIFFNETRTVAPRSGNGHLPPKRHFPQTRLNFQPQIKTGLGFDILKIDPKFQGNMRRKLKSKIKITSPHKKQPYQKSMKKA
jgi:hypothetical protein